jgi:hypothetical protein
MYVMPHETSFDHLTKSNSHDRTFLSTVVDLIGEA